MFFFVQANFLEKNKILTQIVHDRLIVRLFVALKDKEIDLGGGNNCFCLQLCKHHD